MNLFPPNLQAHHSKLAGLRQTEFRMDAAESERQKSVYRSGPLFTLRDTIDTSVFLSNGQLIRSDRLARLEAVLLISKNAVSARKLVQQAGLIDAKEVEQLIELLNTSYDVTQSAFRVEKTATGFLLMSRASLVGWLDRLHHRQSQMKLSQPAMETLTIIAYQQPLTRVRVEDIRGVQSAEMIRQLVDRGLVKVGGEEDSLGRPFLYITTRAFLDMFGLGRLEELPDYEVIGRKAEPDGAEPNEAEPNEAEPNEAEPNEAEPNDSIDRNAEESEDPEANFEPDLPEDQQAA